MVLEREIKRYSAYYRGWCVAFGEHDIVFQEDQTINWAVGENQIGFVPATDLRKRLIKELLGHHTETPKMVFSESHLRVNQFEYEFSPAERPGEAKFLEFLQRHDHLHMFLTSHFCYPTGTRIITFSPKKPLVIFYKEIRPLMLEIPIDQESSPAG